MRQRLSVEASERSSEHQYLNPTLQAALVSLDVQLEDELARYRRQRTKRSVSTPRSFGRTPARKSLDLIAISATGGQTQAAPAPGAPQTQPPGDRSPVESAPIAYAATPAPAWIADAGASSQLALLPDPVAGQENAAGLAYVPTSPDSGDLLHPESDRLGPDDYLESSEELLRSLAEEEAKVRVERSFMQSLLTPMGVGSMLLLLLTSTVFGYIIMNPTSLSLLDWRRLASNPNGSENSALSDASTPESIGISSSLNLADREFQALGLDNLSMASTTTKVRAAGSSVALAPTKVPEAPATVVSERSSSASSVATSSTGAARGESTQVQPAIVSAPVRTQAERSAEIRRTYTPPAPRSPVTTRVTAPAPTTTAPRATVTAPSVAPTQSVSSSQNYQYKVVAPYSNDRTLEQAQKAVPDSYVRNFPEGARIQMGAFGSESEAQERAQQLQKQGIPAEVYQR